MAVVALVCVLAAGALALATLGGRSTGAAPSAPFSTGLSTARPSTPSPSLSAEPEIRVGWREIAGLKPANVTQVANGFIGECIASGRPALCASADAITWSLTPNSAVIAVDGKASFNGWSTARGALGGWVATGTVDPGTWRSTDGVRWTAVAAPVPALQRAHVQALGGGFVMMAETWERDEFGVDGPATRLLTSSDGTDWIMQEVSPDMWFPHLAGAIGLVATQVTLGSESSTTAVVASQDGVNWAQLELPLANSGIGSTIRLPSGGFVGIGTADQATNLLRSADGWTWQAVSGPGAPFDSLTVVGERAWLIARIPGTSTKALWASANGTTWSRVELLDARPIRATQVRRVGEYVGLFDGSRLTMLGTIVDDGHVSPPAPIPAPQSAPNDGISRSEAMRIATNCVHPSKIQAASARIGASFEAEFDRWTWSVTFVLDQYSGVVVYVDLYTGEVLGKGGWIS